MLHRYAFSNFQSFYERVEVDLRVGRKTALTDWVCETPSGERVNKVMAVIGANASGKTALLKPLSFLAWFLRESFQLQPNAAFPLTPHLAHAEEPSEFEVNLDFDGELWRYELRCTKERVLHEALFRKYEKFRYVFVRDWIELGTNEGFYQIKQQGFGLAPQEAEKVREKVSLISWAAQYGVPLAQRLANLGVVTNISAIGRLVMNDAWLSVAAKYFADNEEQLETMNGLLKGWDFGLAGVKLIDLPHSQPIQPGVTIPLTGNQSVTKFPIGIHLSHGIEFPLLFNQESSGTQGAFVLLSRLLPVLKSGGVAVIDEFENDLHPHMLEPILDLFANPESNPNNAQLLFTCHAIEVMNLLDKSQVMLVEKNDQCESTAWRLDQMEGVRKSENYYAKYMAGAYGAVPNL